MSKTAKIAATVSTLILLMGASIWWLTPRASHEIVIAPVNGGQR